MCCALIQEHREVKYQVVSGAHVPDPAMPVVAAMPVGTAAPVVAVPMGTAVPVVATPIPTATVTQPTRTHREMPVPVSK